MSRESAVMHSLAATALQPPPQPPSLPPVHLLWDWDTMPFPASSAAAAAAADSVGATAAPSASSYHATCACEPGSSTQVCKCLRETLLPKLHSLAAQHGRLVEFTVLSSAPLPHAARTALIEAGAALEEGSNGANAATATEKHDVPSDTLLLTRLLRLTLQLSSTPQGDGGSGGGALPCVILLSNLPALTSSLTLMRQSGKFGHIVLLYSRTDGTGGMRELIHAASSAVALEDFLVHDARPSAAAAAPVEAPQPAPPLPVPRIGTPSSNAAAALLASPQMPTLGGGAFSHLQLRLSPAAEEASGGNALLGMPPGYTPPLVMPPGSAMLGVPSPQSGGTSAGSSCGPSSAGSQPLLPTPSPVRFMQPQHSHSNVPSPLHSSGLGSAKSFGMGSARHPRMPSQSAPTSPTSGGSGQRVFFPSSSSPSHLFAAQQQQQQQQASQGAAFQTQQQSHPSFQFSPKHESQLHLQAQQHSPYMRSSSGGMHPQGGAQGPHGHISAARIRACVLAYQRIISYCEQEKLIPRESVLKKRLVDSRADLGASAGGAGAALGGIDFEEFLHVVTNVAQVGLMEGEPPQRIVWPRGADGAPRHFACADFFTPQSRLSAAQNAELMDFLYRVQPEVERGRFGFATYLARHGPPFIQLLPHGVLVELVQLLLNMKVLLFRKGKVSVASKTEAIEAQSLGQFFAATDFLTPAQSHAPSPASSAGGLVPGLPPAAHAAATEQQTGGVSLAAALSQPQYDDKDETIWTSPLTSTVAPSARHIDRTLLMHRRGGTTGSGSMGALNASPLHYSPFSSPLGPPLISAHHHAHSMSLPGSRASSPLHFSGNVGPTQPQQLQSRFEPMSSPPTRLLPPSQQQMQQQQLQQPAHPHPQPPLQHGGFEHMKIDKSLQPLPHKDASRSLFDPSLPPADNATHVVVASAFEPLAQSLNAQVSKAPGWSKEATLLHAAATSSASNSVVTSRRSSLSELDMSSWRNLGGGSGVVAPSGGTAGGSGVSTPVVRYEQSTGFVGESMDACDPAAVLATKLAQLNAEAIAAMSAPSSSGGGVTDELGRFVAAVQFRPCFHFEKQGAAHTPEWIAVLTFQVGSKKYTMRSQTHSKKDAAKTDVAMKALQACEERTLHCAPHVDMDEAGAAEAHKDSVLDLARLLSFLGQAPIVYYLTRMSPSGPAARGGAGGGATGSGRLEGRRASTGQLFSHVSPSHSPQLPASSHALWSGNTRIQVKSVNVLTGEAQPTVSASTPFVHSVSAAPSKADVKEQIAASLLAQIERARIVNPALFTVLAAANGSRPLASLMPSTATTATTATSSASASLDSLWSHSSSSSGGAPAHVPAPIGAPAATAPPPVDMSRISVAEGANGGAVSTSLFSMHTPMPLAAPVSTPSHAASFASMPLTPMTPLQCMHPPIGGGALGMPPILRSVSEAQNEDAELTSKASAESALLTPKHERR